MRLDAVSDALQKVLDQLNKYGPSVVQAAQHQVQVEAQQSLLWGFGFVVLAGILIGIALVCATGYRWERRQYAVKTRAWDAQQALERSAKEKQLAAGEQITIYRDQYSYVSGAPQRPDPEGFVGIGLTAFGLGIVALIPAAIFLLNWWAMSSNPNYYVLQQIKHIVTP